MSREEKPITISDVAEALGVSKTTVSRAISGKGRLSAATRQRVRDYIEEHHYMPNVVARGLAQSKTFNICVVMPGTYALVDLPFFQKAVMGVLEIAGNAGYDILLCVCGENDVSALKRIIQNRKVDGVILLRTYVKDEQIEFLSEEKIPFAVIGSTDYPDVLQVDYDHETACRELTGRMLERGISRIALLGGSGTHVVNQKRRRGFEKAFEEANLAPDPELVFMDLEEKDAVSRAAKEAVRKGAQCIFCMDDAICGHVLAGLRTQGKYVPEDIRVASFYNSSALENSIPSITSLCFDAGELGKAAGRLLLGRLEGEEVLETLECPQLAYEIRMSESTR